MKEKRAYAMTTRAEAAERTRVGILDGFVGLAAVRLFGDISLDDVALASGVTVQTVLRRFGNRAGLVEAAIVHALAEVTAERATPPGEVAGAIRVLVDHYEARGDGVMLLLAQESSEPQVRLATERGRQFHREWVEDVFEGYLPGQDAARQALLDLLVVATDVYTWKQLRRDRGLDRTTTEQRMHQLVSALVTEERSRG